METTNASLINFYIISQLNMKRGMEGVVAQVKLFNSQKTLVATGHSKIYQYDSTPREDYVISSFAALIDPNETYYMQYDVCCKFTSPISGSIRLGNKEVKSFNSETEVANYSIDNSSNPVSGADIIANQYLSEKLLYTTKLPNTIEVIFA